MSREVCLSLPHISHYLTVLGSLPWLLILGYLGPCATCLSFSPCLYPTRWPTCLIPKPGMGSLLGTFSIEQDAFRTAWAPNSFLFSRVLNVGGSRRNKHELSPVPVRQARCDIRKPHAWRGKPLSLQARSDSSLTETKKKKALLKHSHFSTSSFIYRQSTLHPLACTATVRLPSNSSLLSLRRTGRTWSSHRQSFQTSSP